MALNDAQLVMLDKLIYADSKYLSDGCTVSDIVASMKTGMATDLDMNANDYEEWMSFLGKVEKNEALMNYTITNISENGATGQRMACFVDDPNSPSDVNVIFKGTTSPYEWHDNGAGGYMADSPMQESAAEYINNLPAEYGENMTVSGHSKGGNLAQYTTITTDRVGHCVSIDGQGFSQAFIEKYGDEINEKAKDIVSISASNDVVNVLMIPIAGERYYVETEKQDGLLDYHKPQILLDDDGNIRPFTDIGLLAAFLGPYTDYLCETLKEPELSLAIDGLLSIFEEREGGNSDENIFQKMVAVISAIGHIEGFMLDGMIEILSLKYGRTVATIIVAYLYPIAMYNHWVSGNTVIQQIFGTIMEGAVYIGEKLINIGGAIADFAKSYVEAVENFFNSIVEWVRGNFDSGYVSANENTYIRINTETMRMYARQLEDLCKKIRELDKRMDSLYWKVGFRDLKNLLQADLMTGHDWHIRGCINYLYDTAADFDSVENGIEKLF